MKAPPDAEHLYELARLHGEQVRICGSSPPLPFRLADLDEVAVGIAQIAPRLGLMHLGFNEELRTQTFPTFVALCNVRDADVHKLLTASPSLGGSR